jgi:hypothetical protein
MENAAQICYAPSRAMATPRFEVTAIPLPVAFASSNEFVYNIKYRPQVEYLPGTTYIDICENWVWIFSSQPIVSRLQNKNCSYDVFNLQTDKEINAG